ncbi:transporter substrate-binding domain-containing protein [Mycoplasmatota bacterium]|nr:transporter substrate-binding domain-containing protein [Mycoplasmatota bacterium]
MRKLLLTLFLGIFTFTLAACSKKEYTKTFTVGMECAYAPYNWTSPTKTDTAVIIDGTKAYCDGYDVKVSQKIADDLNKELVIKAIKWDGLIPALSTNQIDAIIAGMSPTEKRKQTIAFSDIYFRPEEVVVIKNNSKYVNATSILDFSGAKITSQLGTLHENLISQMTGAIKQTSLPDYSTLVTAVKNGAADGFICELPVATQMANNNSDLKIIRFDKNNGFVVDDSEVSTAIGLRKSDTDLLKRINESLAKISNEDRNTWMNEFINKSSS